MPIFKINELIHNDYDIIRELSPYANWTENDVLNHFSRETLINLIRTSSYARKHPSPTRIQAMNRPQLLEYYQQCRAYATESIIKSLYPLDKLTQPIQHLDCAKEEFYILSRVRTEYECPTVEETAKKRTYLSFTLASHLNLSHFTGSVWYGYFTGITASMIGLILPYDADTRSWARNRQELGADREILLDATDLTAAALALKTYSQISVMANTRCAASTMASTPVTSDCILCIEHVDEASKRASDEQELPILVLHPSDQTFYRIHDYCHDLFSNIKPA